VAGVACLGFVGYHSEALLSNKQFMLGTSIDPMTVCESGHMKFHSLKKVRGGVAGWAAAGDLGLTSGGKKGKGKGCGASSSYHLSYTPVFIAVLRSLFRRTPTPPFHFHRANAHAQDRQI
jgi:hypothetical protein